MNDPSPAEIIFFAALEKATPAERAACLEETCVGNEALRRRVETLLAAHLQVGQFLERPVAEAEGVAALVKGESAAVDLSFLAPPTEADSLGRLDHYEVLEVVGRGGTGVVLRARDTKLLRIVAIKVLAASLAACGTARQRFVREARAAAAVRDDHVIAIYAVCDDAPVPYLVMEFIDGYTLEGLIRRRGPLEVKEVLRIGIQAANGLEAAHKLGLIHRDVKPANILLENGVQRVKLTDFGLARAADDASLTQTALIAGTPLYMAPEQAAGEALDPRTDLFSLGSVLYEMCVGRPAFRAASAVAVIRRVCDETPRPIREVNPDIPAPLCRVIDRLHAKKPADRPASAKQVADLLARLLADLNRSGIREPVGSPDWPSPAPFLRHPPRPWLLAAAAVMLLLAGLGLGEATGVTDVRGTVIRLFSPEGTLAVEVDDPGVSVAVDGGEVVITGAGAKEIRLKPGQYKVEASKDGKVVRQELVTVVRNGRQVVRISQVAALSEVERWERSVAELPAQQQVEAVVRRLKERNPGFDGTVRPTYENGTVTEFRFFTDEVEDISPVRAFPKLRILDCGGSQPRKGKVSDLTPLRGLRLTAVRCDNSQVRDLSPLRGMPLTYLNCEQTGVADLAPVRDAKLDFCGIQWTEVTDLTPLRGMPLHWLDAHGARGLTDLAPLEGLPLRYLNLTQTQVSDLSPLASLKDLEMLVLTATPVSDLTPLRGLGLKELAIQGAKVTDLTPIKELPLRKLGLDYRPEREAFLRSFTGLEVINGKPAAEFWKEAASN